MTYLDNITKQREVKLMENKRLEKYFKVLEKIDIKNSKILDAGCGSGNESKYRRSKIFKDCKIYGLDLNPFDNTYVDYPVCGDLYHIPFKDNSFDVVICEMVAEHIKKPKVMIKELNRVTKKHGKVIIFTPNKLHPIFFLANLLPQKFVDWIKLYYYKLPERENFDVFYKFNDIKTIRRTVNGYFKINELYVYYPEEGFNSKFLLKIIWNIYKICIPFLPTSMRGGLLVVVMEKEESNISIKRGLGG